MLFVAYKALLPQLGDGITQPGGEVNFTRLHLLLRMLARDEGTAYLRRAVRKLAISFFCLGTICILLECRHAFKKSWQAPAQILVSLMALSWLLTCACAAACCHQYRLLYIAH